MSAKSALIQFFMSKLFVQLNCTFRVNETSLLSAGQSLISSLGRGGGLVVSALAFYSDDPSSIPALAT